MTMGKRVPVTREGLEGLKAELDTLTNVKMPQIIAAVAEARSHGDLRENAGYEAARTDQMMAKRRIDELEDLLRHAEIIEVSAVATGIVALGSKVTVDFDGDEETYTIVGAVEANPRLGKVSNESPLGKALLGRKAGQTTTFSAPGGMTQIKILSVD